jgi:outer membrane murein-binding lipoprotein Lpp
MPEWLLPVLIAAGGGTGLGALITALVNAKGSVYAQLNLLVDQLQEDRKTDREELKASRHEVKLVGDKVDNALLHLQIEREYAADLYSWGMNGAPPPPPSRRSVIIQPAPSTP